MFAYLATSAWQHIYNSATVTVSSKHTWNIRSGDSEMNFKPILDLTRNERD